MPDRRIRLVVLAVVPPVVEAVVLLALRQPSALPLAPQVSLIEPYATLHDLRWLLVYHDSRLGFALELTALVAFRSGLRTALVAVAWPASVPRPALIVLLRRNVVATLVMIICLVPWAAAAVAAVETSLSWFVVGELLPLLLLGVALQGAGIAGRWWRGVPPARGVGWTLAGCAVAGLAAGAVRPCPGWWSVAVVAVAAVADAALWWRLVPAALAARRLPRLPVGVLAVLLTGALIAGLAQFATLGVRLARNPPPPIVGPGADAPHRAVVYVAGYDSTYAKPIRQPGLPMIRFSYRGLDGNGSPLPYGPGATRQPLASSARLLARQVEQVRRRTGEPVVLLAQSEGTLVVRRYLDDARPPGVEAAILLSPLLAPGRVYYPPEAGRSGWGLMAGWLLRAMTAVSRRATGVPLGADDPFVRSLLDHAPRYRDRMLCPVPGVRLLVFVPTAGALVMPYDPRWGVPVVEVPGLHGGLLGDAPVQRRILAFIGGDTVRPVRRPLFPAMAAIAAAWQAPSLAVSVNPVWRADARAWRGCARP